MEISQETGLIEGFTIGADGTVQSVDGSAHVLNALSMPEGGYIWLHFDMDAAKRWLSSAGLVDQFVSAALFAPETRPRLITEHGGVLINLRGVNLNPEKNPEDMLSIRAFLQPGRLITVRRQRSVAIEVLRQTLRAGTAPPTAAHLMLGIINGLTDRIEPVVDRLSDRIDELEIEAVEGGALAIAEEVTEIRHDTLVFRRYMIPQREAVAKFAALGSDWLDQDSLDIAKEQADRMLRVTEELDITRERSGILNDQVTGQRSDRMNRNMMVISIASAIFLPLSFLTGLFGMNVAGLPGTQWNPAFVMVCVGCVVIAAILGGVLKLLDWY
ncbi:zinc transporter ZntB [Parvularcula sp. LCG005]|uniref:zinc transporter ZntB n=1 Tax=Parvularcula sp. LCG005 TaxID=3078805 RepID=UPI00294380BA|nr:zinc transporter ZntB [Parvularcula sp. LCG005]WOI53082.1 zinc transporter ZntB [Parvularcula sp. LCG005]